MASDHIQPFLYRYEAKSIQSYVLGTGKLREIAGASGLIESLESDARAAATRAGGTVYAAAAGGATMTFPDQRALERFASRWPLTCALSRPGLHIIQAWARLGQADKVTDAEWQVLQDRLRSARQRRHLVEPLATPLVARAQRTGRAAVRIGAHQAPLRLVDAMSLKHDESYAGPGADSLFRRSLPPAFRTGPTQCWPVEDMDEFGEGYVAVIHADGNGFGKVFMQPRALAEYREISQAVAACTEGALHVAIDRLVGQIDHDGSFRRTRKIPFRPIVLGGDDLTLIVRASEAIPFAALFLEEFERSTRRDPVLARSGISNGIGFSAAAGIAMVKPGFPFRSALRLAEELCSASKDPFRNLPSADVPSALTFHRVTTASLRSWNDVRSAEMGAASGTRQCTDSAVLSGALSGGPWLVGERAKGGHQCLSQLAALANAVDAAPRGGIREWLRLAVQEPDAAESHWRRMRDVARVQGGGEWRALDDALASLGANDGPWRDPAGGERLSTPLLDGLVWARVTERGFVEPWGATR